MSTTLPRRVAMADGGRAVDDIDLAFDWPSEVQATYTTPAGYEQARMDKEMGYPDQRLLYGLIAGIGLAALYSAVSSTLYSPADPLVPPAAAARHLASSSPSPKVDTTVSSIGHDADTLLGAAKSHIPAILTGNKKEESFVTVRKEGEKDRHLPSRPPTDSKLERMVGRGG
ncbi:hypothetical protein B0T18DRAFT_425911 [Schizothecium vesticola]|uniref:Uncharacterized protein n=1 Tax=Schizothecium vesticola TaxID=314040 RepID=A0AA40F582_9PEZI|nr:hypothetical protein B0T18DRAFT_425911 [Schizothecium vesticola]